MQVTGNYLEQGYAHLQQLIPPQVARAFLQGLKEDVGPAPIPLSRVQEHPNLLKRPAFEIYGHHYKPLLYFLWGLTPTVSEIVGRELLPTYDYFRVYRRGDVCRVHSDRYSCEHSLSLTLDYSDDEIWDIEIGKANAEPSARVEEGFGDEAYSSIRMQVGDALLYQGVTHRHGRIQPNPNAWSAHLFLHWVDSEGPYREHAFDGQIAPSRVSFSFS
jgi:hypothetical protein